MLSAQQDVFALADAAGVGVYRARLSDGRVTAANDAFLQMFGHHRDDLVQGAVNWRTMTPAETLRLCDELAVAVLADGGRYVRIEKCYHHRDGTPIPVAISCALHPEDDYGLCFVMDLRPQRRLECELREVQRHEPMARLAAGVAHDVNNLLTIIAGQLDQVAAGTADDRLRERLRIALLAVERAGDVSRRMLAYGRGRTAVGVVDLAALVRANEGLLAAMLTRRVRLRLELDAVVAVHGDRTALLQVLLNLAANARDAMPGGGSFTVVLRAADGEAVLACRDTGVGMDPAMARTMFEPWVTTKGEAGNGIGLAVVAGAVRDGGGTIAVDSHPGVGTTFTVRLPLAGASVGRAAG